MPPLGLIFQVRVAGSLHGGVLVLCASHAEDGACKC